MEQVMVVASVAAIMVFAVPAAKDLFNKMKTPAGTRNTISSALATAKAMAAKNQRYVGVRFQHSYYIDDPVKSPLKSPQYMIFIIHDVGKTGYVDGFTAIEGMEPIKLPDNIGVMDLYIDQSDYEKIDGDTDLNTDEKLNDATTFSIVFSPAGKVIVRDVLAINRDGQRYNQHDSEDDIFNTQQNVDAGFAMFIQDHIDDTGNTLELEKEPSRRAFIIYDRSIFLGIDQDQRYTDYIGDLINDETIYLNSYTGTMIDK
jgi:hypothetical protein